MHSESLPQKPVHQDNSQMAREQRNATFGARPEWSRPTEHVPFRRFVLFAGAVVLTWWILSALW